MSATSPPRVLLVEDHTAFRQALAFLLTNNSDLEVVAQAGSLAEAREEIGALDQERLDVALIALGLPDGDGRQLLAELRRSNPHVSVVVLSATIEAGHIEELLEAGADGVLDKVESPLTIAQEVMRIAGR